MLLRIVIISATIILLILGGIWAIDYFALFQDKPKSNERVYLNTESQTTDNDNARTEVPYEIEIFAEGLYVPWSMVFTNPNRMLVTERSGAVRVVENGQLLSNPLHVFGQVSTQSEEGLMGMALHPAYDTNNRIYFSYAYTDSGEMFVRVVSFIDDGDALTDEVEIIDTIPAARFHAGSRIKFGPDEKLYITTGDATEKNLAQNPESLAGKILRLNDDGTIPEDNPFPGSPIYSIGHRNPQGIDWYPGTNILYATEHGPSLFDGPAGGDEINIIEAGENYGWPIVSHEETQPEFIDPEIVFTPAIAPASGAFYTSDALPQFKNNFLVGMLRGTGIMRFVISPENPNEILFYERLPIQYGRIRTVIEGPDGAIYFSTSNEDGRGTMRPGGDIIYRIYPES